MLFQIYLEQWIISCWIYFSNKIRFKEIYIIFWEIIFYKIAIDNIGCKRYFENIKYRDKKYIINIGKTA